MRFNWNIPSRYAAAAGFLVVAAIVAITTGVMAQAALNDSAVEVEDGAKIGKLAEVANGTASGKSAIKFGTAPTTGGTIGGGTTTGGGTATGDAAIKVSGNKITRGGQDWWFLGYNSFVWSANCGNPEEEMSAEDVEAWFASMRHDGHGLVRLFFYDGWDFDRLDSMLASAKKHNVYVTLTLDDAIGGCGENDKDAGWFDNAGERSVFKAHMIKVLNQVKGNDMVAWLEYFNEPDYEGGKLRQFYDEMGAAADTVDPTRLFASGTVAPYWVDGEANFKDIHESPGVDIASLHEYDQDEVESNHGDNARANAAGKPMIVGEFGIDSSSGGGCKTSFGERASRFKAKADAYLNTDGYIGALAWAWQPGNGGGSCEYGNLDADEPTQEVLRTTNKK